MWPAPSPSSSRPSVNRSTTAASRANTTGCRKSLFITSVPTRMRSVASAAATSAESDENMPSMRWSAISKVSNPADSARLALVRQSSRLAAPHTEIPNRKGRSVTHESWPLRTTLRGRTARSLSGMTDFRALHDAENADFSAFLHTLDVEDWERTTLCAGWRVRDVVGHILYGQELKLWTLPWKLARFGFSSDRSGRHYSIQRAEGRRPEDLLYEFDHRNPWSGTSRVFPPHLNLMDRLVHHQDIRRALGRPRVVQLERMSPLLPYLPKLGQVFRSKRRMRGLRFDAT